jgi:hypothetical protein
MKCETTNTILTFVLGVLAIAGVVFAIQTFNLTREFRSLTVQATVANNSLMQVQALAADVAAYNQKTPSPELTKLLNAAQTPSMPAKK